MYVAIKTGTTWPWYPTWATFIPNISHVGAADGFAAKSYADIKAGWTNTRPKTTPNKGFPPNFLAADQPINAGKNVKDVFAIKFIIPEIPAIPVFTSITDCS